MEGTTSRELGLDLHLAPPGGDTAEGKAELKKKRE
jgi:hypothetical protein